MFIYFTYYHIVHRGEATRHVTCEKCQHAYAYQLARVEKLDVLPPLEVLLRRGQQICRDRLARRLAHDVDAVPCPSCGWMQSHMLPELRRRFLKPLKTVGAFIAISGAVLALPFVALGLFLPTRAPGYDINWFGIAAATAAVAVFGISLIALQKLLGLARYGRKGFISRSKASLGPLLSAA